MDVKRANETYQDFVISKYDERYISHFPHKIEYLPMDIMTVEKGVDCERQLIMDLELPSSIIDTLFEYYTSNNLSTYKPSIEGLLIVNRFLSKENQFKRKLASQSEIDIYTKSFNFSELFPIPNFCRLKPSLLGQTECHLSSDFEIFIIESKPDKLINEELTVSEYMPVGWKNGFSRGVSISKSKKKIIYWFVFW